MRKSACTFLLWYQACQVRPLDLHRLQRHLRDRRVIPHHLLQPTVGEIQVREREDEINSDTSPVPVSKLVDDGSGQPEEIQANKTQIPKSKERTTIERGNLYDDPEIPEWLQEFRENLVDDEKPLQGGSHASSSHEVSLEPTSKRREDLGKHSVYTHFPKDRNCDICKRTKMTRDPCRRRNGGAVPRAENVGDLITADHKVLSESLNLEANIDMQSWCRTRPPNGSNRIRAKRKLHRKHKRACKSSWSRRGNQKSFTLTFPWNLANLVKTFLGIIVRQHLTDRKQMGLLRERYAETRKGLRQYCCNLVWMKIGGRIPWSVAAICRAYKISCLMGRHFMRGGSENHLKIRLFRFERW